MTPSESPEKSRFLKALYLPFIFVLIIWIVKYLEWFSGQSFTTLGIHPQKANGIIGILLAPLVHSNLSHLINNSVPILILGTSLFYFYRNIALKVFCLVYLISGLCVWFGGRDSYHIGASGIVYGLASFLFFSGLIRKIVTHIAISLLTVFLYGGLIWGILPIWPEVSWESHFYGGLAGLILSLIYKDEGPQKKEPEFDNDDDDADPYWMVSADDDETTKDNNV